nr:glycosyltransferase [Anaerolineae bacterium]
MTLLALIHALVALWLAIYGLNSFILAFLYLRHRREDAPAPSPNPSTSFSTGSGGGEAAPENAAPTACPSPMGGSALPPVTVQVPVYNELHVVERVIDSVAALDYPRERLQIQILDDSTDGTTHLARARAALHRERGVDIAVLRRPDRSGYKAGALTWGLSQARGEYIVIFDADFCPHPDFLLQTVPHFLARPRLGLVQARWSYLNADADMHCERNFVSETRCQHTHFRMQKILPRILASRFGEDHFAKFGIYNNPSQRFTVAPFLGIAHFQRRVHVSKFVSHPKHPLAQGIGNVLAGFALQRQLKIVNGSGSVSCHKCKNISLDQIDNERTKTIFNQVRA